MKSPETPPQLQFIETTNLNIVDHLLQTDPQFADWPDRIHRRFDHEANWSLQTIKQGNDTIGFSLVSRSQQKLDAWNNKFLEFSWIPEPIELETAAQLAYFFIQPAHRNQGLGASALYQLFDHLKTQDVITLYGFSRYDKPLSLYQRTGARILGKSLASPKGSYYYWQL